MNFQPNQIKVPKMPKYVPRRLVCMQGLCRALAAGPALFTHHDSCIRASRAARYLLPCSMPDCCALFVACSMPDCLCSLRQNVYRGFFLTSAGGLVLSVGGYVLVNHCMYNVEGGHRAVIYNRCGSSFFFLFVCCSLCMFGIADLSV